MAISYGRWFSPRDLKLISSINNELLGDMIQQVVMLYKICPNLTETNIYGETNQQTGKIFFPGVEMVGLIERADITTDNKEYGPTRNQNVAFRFKESLLKEINFYPETGDIIEFNERYHEIDNVVQEQFLGGIPEKSWSIIVNTHYSRLSKINIVNR